MHVTALQDRCIAKEGVVTRVMRHNAHLMEEQGQYKEAVRTLNRELKEVREKLVEAGRQSEKLKGEMTVLEQIRPEHQTARPQVAERLLP